MPSSRLEYSIESHTYLWPKWLNSMTKAAKKTIPIRAAHTYISYIGDFPPGTGTLQSFWLCSCKNAERAVKVEIAGVIRELVNCLLCNTDLRKQKWLHKHHKRSNYSVCFLSQSDQIGISYYFNLFSLVFSLAYVLSPFGEIWQTYELRIKEVN